MPVKLFIVHRVDVVDAIERRGGRLGIAQLLFKRGQFLERIRVAAAQLFVIGQHGGGRLLVALGQVRLGQKLVGVCAVDVVGIQAAHFLAFFEHLIVIVDLWPPLPGLSGPCATHRSVPPSDPVDS